MDTQRLRLRPLATDDLDALVDLDSDPEVMRWLSGGTATPREFLEEVVLPGFLATYPGCPWLGAWAIEDGDGTFLGWVSLRPSHPGIPTTATLGYRLRRGAWGRGVATEAARTVLAWAFGAGDLELVQATVYEANAASRRVLEKLGLWAFGRLRLTPDDLTGVDTFHAASGEPWDGADILYRLDRAGWRGGPD